jgi:hypothetical protein
MKKIYTKIVWNLTDDGMVLDNEEFYLYNGECELMCGATAAQNSAQAAQASAYTQMTQQASQVFGSSSQVFNQLQSTFAPTVAAGPSQQGFSAQEVSNLDSEAVTQGGVAARNAQQAAGESIAAQGGGNEAALQNGTNAGVKANIDVSAAENTANNLATITQANYNQGNQNYNNAVAGLAGSTNVFNPASTAGNAATGAGTASANTANQIASQDQSWVQAVTGALGGVAGSFASGGLGKLIGTGSGSGSGGSGGSGNVTTDLIGA